MTRQNAAQAATSSIQETQQSIAADEADLKATAKRWEEKLANKRVMTVLVLYAADCSSTVGACDIPCHNST